MQVSQIFAGKWLKATDMQDGPLTAEIEGVTMEEVGVQRETVAVLHLRNQKPLILKAPVARYIAELAGDDMTGWTGYRVTLKAVDTLVAGKAVQTVRAVAVEPPRQGDPQAPFDDPIPFGA